MRPFIPTEFNEDDDAIGSERDLESHPERSNRPNASRRVRMQATRRNRSNEVARRGMHQRRRKRFSW
jgi:hypothetical protein